MGQKGAYFTLNLRKGASEVEIRERYFTLVKRYDPERHTDRFMIIQKAFERLSDPVKRAQEDILTFNPVQGRFEFLDEEREIASEADLAGRAAQIEARLAESGGKGSEQDYQELAQCLMRRGASFITRRLYQKAIECWERVLQIEPAHQRAKHNLFLACAMLAYSYADHDLLEEAIDLWVKASMMNPDDDTILHNLALASEAAGKKSDAERYWGETLRRWKSALDRDPANDYLRNSILEVHRHHGAALGQAASQPTKSDQNADASQKAVEEYKEILKIAPNDYEAQFQVASAQMEQRQFDEAVESLKALAQKSPRIVAVLNLLGWALLNTGQIDAGFMVWRQSQIIAPKNTATRDCIVRAHTEVGRRCRDQGQYNSALKHFKALQRILGPQHVDTLFEIALTYQLKGDKRAAFVELQNVVKLEPRHQVAQKMLKDLRMR